jgi:hypothetical protein
MFINETIFCVFSSSDSDGEPSAKVRKTSVLVNQPSQDKVVVDSVPDNVLNLDEVILLSKV